MSQQVTFDVLIVTRQAGRIFVETRDHADGKLYGECGPFYVWAEAERAAADLVAMVRQAGQAAQTGTRH